MTPMTPRRRWVVGLVAINGAYCGDYSTHWFRWRAERVARRETRADSAMSQLLGSRWIVRRSDEPVTEIHWEPAT